MKKFPDTLAPLNARRDVLSRLALVGVCALSVACSAEDGSANATDEMSELSLASRAVDSTVQFADTSLTADDPAAAPTPDVLDVVPPPSKGAIVTPAPAPAQNTPSVRSTVLPAPPEPVVTPAPAPAPRGPLVIPSGTVLGVIASGRRCAPDLKVGDEIQAVMDRPFEIGTDILVERGAAVVLRVVTVSNNAITFTPVRARTRDGEHTLSGTVGVAQWDTVQAPKKKRGILGALAGAAVAAGAAAATGKDAKTAVIAAAVGAGAGASVAAASAGSHICLPDRARLAIELDAPVRVVAP